MSTYIVVNSTVKNPEIMQKYVASNNCIEEFGGEILARGPVQVLSGEHLHENMVIIQFPSANNAKKWYNSPQYQKLKTILDKAADCSFTLCGD